MDCGHMRTIKRLEKKTGPILIMSIEGGDNWLEGAMLEGCIDSTTQ